MLEGRTATSLLSAVNSVVDFSERKLAEGLSSEESAAIACRAGCGTCCRVNVSVLWPEAFAIANHINLLPPQERSLLEQKLEHVALRTRWMEDEERIHLCISCPFLSDVQACSIYPVRPLLCRSITSTDPIVCKAALDAVWEDEVVPVVMNLFQKALMETSFRSFGEALVMLGMDHKSVELVSGVRAALRYPDLVNDYLASRPFDTHIFD